MQSGYVALSSGPASSPCKQCHGKLRRGLFGPVGLGLFTWPCGLCGGTGMPAGRAGAGAVDTQSDRQTVLRAVKKDGTALQHAGDAFKSDREVVLTAVTQNGNAFAYTSDNLKADRAFVLAAVQLHGLALLFASERFKADREVVLAATRQYPTALMFAADELRADEGFVIAVVQSSGIAVRYAADCLKANRCVALAAVREDGHALQHVAESMKSEREIVIAAVQQSGDALWHASELVKSDHEVIRAAGPGGARHACKLEFEVRATTGDCLCMISERDRGMTLQELKQFIEFRAGVPVDVQRLSVKGVSLEDLSGMPLVHGRDPSCTVILLERSDIIVPPLVHSYPLSDNVTICDYEYSQVSTVPVEMELGTLVR